MGVSERWVLDFGDFQVVLVDLTRDLTTGRGCRQIGMLEEEIKKLRVKVRQLQEVAFQECKEINI